MRVITTGVAVSTCAAMLGSALAGAPEAAVAGGFSPTATRTAAQCVANPYLRDNWDLGAKDLPTTAPVGPLVQGYSRINGSSSPKAFFDLWKDENQDWSWRYPPKNGFDGQPNEVTLPKGTRLDRFGSPNGSFLSPVVNLKPVSYQQRSLPPSSLRTYAGDVECNYHLYEVTQPITVQQGAIAAWFGQTGGGTQVMLLNGVKVRDLLGNSLKEITSGRHATQRTAIAAQPVKSRSAACAALLRAGIPDDTYRIDGVHEPRLTATEYYRLRRVAGQWELTLSERVQDMLVARYADESRAAERLYEELTRQP